MLLKWTMEQLCEQVAVQVKDVMEEGVENVEPCDDGHLSTHHIMHIRMSHWLESAAHLKSTNNGVSDHCAQPSQEQRLEQCNWACAFTHGLFDRADVTRLNSTTSHAQVLSSSLQI